MAHPFIPAPNVALIEMVYTYSSQVIENTFHVKQDHPWSAAELQSLCLLFDAWDSTGTTTWAKARNFWNVLTQIKGRALDTASSPVFFYTLPVPRAGIRAGGAPLPGNVSFAVALQTGLAGRSYRGRIYVPGIQSSDIQGSPQQGLVTASLATAALQALQQLLVQISAHGTGTWQWVVTSYYNNHAWRPVAVSTPITAISYRDLYVDSMRRRLPGRGL